MKYTWNGLRIKNEYSITLATASLIGSIIAGVVAAGSAIGNTVSQAKTNQTNTNNVNKTNELNESLTREAWKRDDSQLQRARADAEAAGFSPLAALSNNLTNTAPATMQAPMVSAPQFDSSGITDSIQSGISNYHNAKNTDAQEKFLKEQTKGLKLENKFKSVDLFQKQLQNAANLAKTLKELDAMDLSNADKASLLVSNGFTSEQVQKLLKHTKLDSIASNKYQDAIRILTQAQTTTEGYKQALTKAQEMLSQVQRQTSKTEADYWYKPLNDPKWNITFPYDIDSKGNIQYATLEASGKSRKELLDLYNQYVNEFTTKMDKSNMDFDNKMKIWQNVNSSTSAVMSMFKPISLQ